MTEKKEKHMIWLITPWALIFLLCLGVVHMEGLALADEEYQRGHAEATDYLLQDRIDSFANGYYKRMDDEVVNYTWYLRFGNDTILIDYPNEAATEPFAYPRDAIHQRCLNGSWYCTERICIVLKADRIPELGGGIEYLCSEQYFEDMEKMFKESGVEDYEIELSDLRIECAIQAEQGGAV